MKKVLNHLRKQSEETKTHILHVTMIVVSVALFMLWVVSFGATVTNKDTAKNLKEDLKPFSALKANLVDGYKDISDYNR